jgi:primary-amine oxidase
MALLALGAVLTWTTAALAEPRHPLDPLSTREYWDVFDVMKASGKLGPESRFSAVSLQEPPKAEVLAWTAGKAFRREVKVVVHQDTRTFEGVVDLASKRLTSWKDIPGVKANLTLAELDDARGLVQDDPDWRAAMDKRGIRDFETLECFGSPSGYFGTAEEKAHRLERITCDERRGDSTAWGRPVEGVVAVYDLDAKKLVRVIDTGVVPVPPVGSGDYDAEAIGAERDVPSPIHVEQPAGPGFRLDGHEVSWQNWRFHVRVEPRIGLVLSLVRVMDGGRARSVLYQGSLSEIFVPYMDPSEGWLHATYIDAGDYGNAEGLLKPLERGTDCPAGAVYLDSQVADEHGRPQPRPRSACLFEREAGEIAWRHTDGPDAVVSRPRRDLVVRSVAVLGNYDYVLDWVFLQDGSLKVVVGATGMLAVKGAVARTAADTPGGAGDPYGRYVAPHTVAVNHDHFFSYRLDFDVDGTSNSFERDELVKKRAPEGSLRKSFWTVEPRIARTERDGMVDAMGHSEGLLRVVNPAVRGPLGYPVSYELRPGHGASMLLDDDDWPRKRAGFADHMVWVTPERDDERYAAGDYVTMSQGGDGLPRWTSANRPIEKTDIVVWYTFGMHHAPRAEDWPLMPALWHELEIRPYDFFARNPALDLPRPR